ncbi:hypothetical protein AUJ84_00205 [Candidatus Pacearchaeota archaeon CG1_02_32_132]|nr:MAG: hypothetical protein AUJ84_00205 [Candidatus Pacearchaeota archaeon CG1_02_32_132]
MVNMTLSIPEELARRMKLFREIRWSEVVRQAIEDRITNLEAMERIASKSKLTEKDAKEISKLINRSVTRKLNLE